MSSVQETARDRTAKHKSLRRYASSFEFPVLDFLLFVTILRCEMTLAQIIECIRDICEPTMLPPLSTIRSRLNILAHEGLLAHRQEGSKGRLYFSITDKGKGRLHEMCKLVPFLNDMAKAATVELAEYVLARRRPWRRPL